jgi:hypothetical protein
MGPKDPIEIYVENEKIILKKCKANMECDVTGHLALLPIFDAGVFRTVSCDKLKAH